MTEKNQGQVLAKDSISPKVKFSFGGVATIIFLLAYAVFSVVPMIWLALAPSKNAAELVSAAPMAFGSPQGYLNAWNNLMTFEDGVLVTWIVNSIWYTFLIVTISSLSALSAGYALASTAVPLKRFLLSVTLVAMIIPAVALVLPLFLEVSAIGAFDTPWAVILPSSFYPFGVFLAYIHFSTSIPRDVYEAAKIDGAGEFATFAKIAFPLSKGLLGMLAFFSFSAAWANYFLPYVLLSSSANYTLPVGLGLLFSSTPSLNPLNGAQSSVIGRPEIALAGLLVGIPILIVFLLSSRFLVRGILAGAVKS